MVMRVDELKIIKIDLLAEIVKKKQEIEKVEDTIANPDIHTGFKERKQRKVLQRQVDSLFRRLSKANLELRNIKYGKKARKERIKREANG